MTTDTAAPLRASRFRVARSRGALSGILLVVFGAWAAIVPFIGPYLDFAYTPSVNSTWNWTAGRGWLNVLPGCVAIFGGLLLLASASRVVTSIGGWLAAAAGAWLIVGPPLAVPLQLGMGTPDPSSTTWVQTLERLFFYFAVGAAILFLASVALGRLSVHSVRDVRAAQRRAELEEAAAAEEARLAADRAAADRDRAAATRREPAQTETLPPTRTETGRTETLPPAETGTAATPGTAGPVDGGRHVADGTPGNGTAGTGYPSAPTTEQPAVGGQEPQHWWSRRHRVESTR